MLPPFARGGMVTSIESVAGATAITPANGRIGTAILSLKRTTVSPGENLKILRKGSLNSSARNPNPGIDAAQPQSFTSTLWTVTASTSPGVAPSTKIGPVSG